MKHRVVTRVAEQAEVVETMEYQGEVWEKDLLEAMELVVAVVGQLVDMVVDMVKVEEVVDDLED